PLLSLFRTDPTKMSRLAFAGILLVLASCASSSQPDLDLPPTVPFVSRAEWNAKAPAFEMVSQTPSQLTIHHTATPQNPDADPRQTLRNLQDFSQREDTLGNGRMKVAWADVPYHFYIAPDGTVLEARDPAYEGDTNTNYDLTGHIHVVLEGNFMNELPTDAQMRSLRAVSAALGERYGIGPDAVGGHGDHAVGQTLCPGDALGARLDEVRAVMPRQSPARAGGRG
ncbi:MAG: peptidoglycan recognition family protein, partial [Bacteroidota bacterium]